jgi:hypothetical protein
LELERLVAEYARRQGIPSTEALVEGVNTEMNVLEAVPLTVEEFVAVLLGIESAGPVLLAALFECLSLNDDEAAGVLAAWHAVAALPSRC